ncbi:autotransporter outer membrane beta-barrel domain-containing protein [Kluyvera genomosp. 3]|uniref:Autotransporter outer membrane beta-barrel domain-containing protein n=1 Tax=Kluyvera genomosp. 3 TaxID=2774055 RepID=A0A6G9RLL8_9ENTR|nr:autotransporter outer membrane beta-barrel domain-containing protein [Kluyvera genomosp. 3]QIR27810.1 autotransporter outer membrane beta-barrel domain-containing protein [Kluyvera genomosp. 3]
MSQYKIKPLSLLIASALAFTPLAQAIVTDVGNGEVVNNTEVDYGDELNINSGGESNDTVVNNGGLETVLVGGNANNTIIQSGGTQLVDGTATGSVLNGAAKQVISDGGVSHGTQVGSYGMQTVHNGGSANGTVLNGGFQTVNSGGVANNTVVNSGSQTVDAGGLAENSTLNITGGQVVYGTANNTVINGGGMTINMNGVANDAMHYSGAVVINAGGTANSTFSQGDTVYVSGGTNNDNKLSGYAYENISDDGVSNGSVLTDSAIQTIVSGTSRNAELNGSSTLQNIMNGSSAIGTKVNDGLQRIYSGGHATGTIVNGGQQHVYGTITDTTLNAGKSLLFSGSRAEGYTEVNSDAALVIYTNAVAEDITLNGGTLQVAALSGSSSGQPSAQVEKLTMDGGLVQFNTGYTYGYAQLNIGELNGNGNIWFETSLADKAGSFVTIGHGSGSFGVIVQDSGKEIADHTDLTLNLINDQGGDIDFALQSARGGSTRAVDGGAYMYVLKQETGKNGMDGNVWYLGAMTDEEGGDSGNGGGDGDNGSNGGSNGGGNLVTTPSTDAILSLANAGLNIMRGEMDGLRAARQSQSRDRQHGEGSVWGHYLGKKSAAETSNGAAYKLYQNGMELGGDVVTDLGNSQLVTGGFVSLTGNNVKHARGGTSSVDSYGLGAYATWYDNSGFYLDGTLKANRLESQLSARMTNGDMTSGKWHQYGLSTALEAGYTFTPMNNLSVTPFARMTGTTINDANVKLNNGMTAKTGKARSLTAEAGGRVASNFSLGNTALRPYLSISVEQELAHSNEAVINDVNRFKNHQNGTSGKYGAGITVSPAKDVTLYGELNYRQGSYVEDPVQGMAGIRISF